MERDVYFETILLKKFGKHIKEIRISNYLTQEKAALLCELNQHYLSDLENGRKNPSLKVLYKLSEGYNISLEELMNF